MIREEAARAAAQLFEVAKMKEGELLVVGCSSSEIGAEKIGTHSSAEIGQAVFEGIKGELDRQGVFLAAQCCEHLNRAIIVEAEAVGQGEICNVVPQPKAGGSFATAAYHGFRHPFIDGLPQFRAGITPHFMTGHLTGGTAHHQNLALAEFGCLTDLLGGGMGFFSDLL